MHFQSAITKILLLAVVSPFFTTAYATDPIELDIYLVDTALKETPIGQLSLTPDSTGTFQSKVSMDDSKFTNYFLSMRPFKCITADTYQLCHLPYPYENKRRITSEDLVDLEYDLLFIRRSTKDYGINPWFGIYYKLHWNPRTGLPDGGELREVNLDLLASPPADSDFRPIPNDELYEADPQQHQWPYIQFR